MNKPTWLTTAGASLALASLGAGAAAEPLPVLDPRGGPGAFTEQNLAQDRTEKQFFYRIPALAHLGNGVVLAAWDARPGSSADAPNPNSIIMRRSTDGGRTWSDYSFIASGSLTGADGTRGPGGDAARAGKFGYSDPSFVVDEVAGKVFAFFVYSKDTGLLHGAWGADDADRAVMGAVVVESSDGGLTWSEPRSVTGVAKSAVTRETAQAGDIRSVFASSGQGIQLKYGAHKGRLVQQFAGFVRQADGRETTQAFSVYSDDHGATWQRGETVGTDMDENKVVELSDGRLMLNSRNFAREGFRKVAYSNDGGRTWGPVTLDRTLTDPRNNGSITRLFPNAPQGSPDARKLLFTNSNHERDRRNVSARVSCDDGATWSSVRTVRPGFSAYSTATRLDPGRIGILYETGYTASMSFAAFDDAWLNYTCAAVSVPETAVTPGDFTEVPVTVTNTGSEPLVDASVTVDTPEGWSAPRIPLPRLDPGQSITVGLDLRAPAGAQGTTRLEAVVLTPGGQRAQGAFSAVAPLPAQVTGTVEVWVLEPRDYAAQPLRVGEQVKVGLRVRSTTAEAVDAVPVSGNVDKGFLANSRPNCRWLNLPANGHYTCSTAVHTVTQEDVDRGWYQPAASMSFTLRSNPSLSTTVSGTGPRVPVAQPAPSVPPAPTTPVPSPAPTPPAPVPTPAPSVTPQPEKPAPVPSSKPSPAPSQPPALTESPAVTESPKPMPAPSSPAPSSPAPSSPKPSTPSEPVMPPAPKPAPSVQPSPAPSQPPAKPASAPAERPMPQAPSSSPSKVQPPKQAPQRTPARPSSVVWKPVARMTDPRLAPVTVGASAPAKPGRIALPKKGTRVPPAGAVRKPAGKAPIMTCPAAAARAKAAEKAAEKSKAASGEKAEAKGSGSASGAGASGAASSGASASATPSASAKKTAEARSASQASPVPGGVIVAAGVALIGGLWWLVGVKRRRKDEPEAPQG